MDQPLTTTSKRPYLIRAVHEWLCDNELTSHVLVNAEYPGVDVPSGFVEDGQIVLNISPTAVNGLVADNDGLFFSARFGGVPTEIYVPMNAVIAIFAREDSSEGMVFHPVEPPEPGPDGPSPQGESTASKPPTLRVVK